jgi:hypothetical protein
MAKAYRTLKVKENMRDEEGDLPQLRIKKANKLDRKMEKITIQGDKPIMVSSI